MQTMVTQILHGRRLVRGRDTLNMIRRTPSPLSSKEVEVSEFIAGILQQVSLQRLRNPNVSEKFYKQRLGQNPSVDV